MTDINQILRNGFGRGDSSQESDVHRLTAELRAAAESQDLERIRVAELALDEAVNASQTPEPHPTNFNGGVRQPVPQRRTPAEQMNDFLKRSTGRA